MTAAFRCTLAGFNETTLDEKLGSLAAAEAARGFATHQNKQTEAWRAGLAFLAGLAAECKRHNDRAGAWRLLVEFEIPRRGRRPDAILVADDLIFVLEFKIGATEFSAADRWQAMSYALDLRDFHCASHGRRIVPILIATATASKFEPRIADDSLVSPVVCLGSEGPAGSASIICDLYNRLHDPAAATIDADAWEKSYYRPTPTIIEAAQLLFAGHTVNDISHSFARNLDETCDALVAAIQRARSLKERAICFVTGIPGAGKTLAGLNVVHNPTLKLDGKAPAVFLSGNGPLVKIVRAALVRDRVRAGMNKADAKRTVTTFIQNVHGFIKSYAIDDDAAVPYENAIVFDEAQRAWDADAVAKKHKLAISEPEMVLEIMERAPGWAAIIALVGGGQEINQGEAGLAEWGRALRSRRVPWHVYASPAVLEGDDSVAGQVLFAPNVSDSKQSELAASSRTTANRLNLGEAANDSQFAPLNVARVPALHLDVSVRSPRARRISQWVNRLLIGDLNIAPHTSELGPEFPVAMTRSLDRARQWLRQQSEGIQNVGLLASSGALRLRAHGLELSTGFRHGYSYEHWFLAGAEDSRSSSWLEVAATEFECQGLELDWTGICWGGDFLFSSAKLAWMPRNFRGAKWQNVRQNAAAQYVLNKYRVLLTRARRGMIIWVPHGSEDDRTQEPELFDATANLLISAGVANID